MFYILLWQLIVTVLAVSAANPTRTSKGTKRHNTGPPPPANFSSDQFVTTKDGQFFINGSVFKLLGTNAYWLSALNNEQDIDYTLGNISAAGFNVVRTWAFNDVEAIPENGTWFQLISNGTTMINNGTNGLQKLDKVVELAQKHGIYLLLSLTNNWSPIPGADETLSAGLSPLEARQLQGTNITNITRNSLSNSYGGMDVYVRNLVEGNNHTHDQFYLNQTVLNAFKNYTALIASRYANHSNVFSWELANDPRCNSSLPAAGVCNTNTVTGWHADVAKTVSQADPNHLVSSGNQGYFCADCPKLFPRVVPPPPAPSPAPGTRRRTLPEPLSKSKLLKERKAAWKKERERQKRSGELPGGVKIRGRWVASQTKRQGDLGIGSAFDGTHGVDSEDIINIPQIGFGSFQLFPDQYTYGDVDPNLPFFNQTLQAGLDWINRHAEIGRLFGKPVSLTGFGLVTQNNLPFYVPFNGTLAPFAPDQVPTVTTPQPFGVTDAERDEAYSQWIKAGIAGGLQGIIQYQWSQPNLTAQEGTAVTVAPNENTSGTTPNENTSGLSPNDGYGLSEGLDQAIDAIKGASQGFVSDTSSGA